MADQSQLDFSARLSSRLAAVPTHQKALGALVAIVLVLYLDGWLWATIKIALWLLVSAVLLIGGLASYFGFFDPPAESKRKEQEVNREIATISAGTFLILAMVLASLPESRQPSTFGTLPRTGGASAKERKADTGLTDSFEDDQAGQGGANLESSRHENPDPVVAERSGAKTVEAAKPPIELPVEQKNRVVPSRDGGGTLGETITNSVGMKLAFIPAGEFWMGSPETESRVDATDAEDERLHRVQITKPFYMGVYEVTQGEYKTVIGKNPSWFTSQGDGNEVTGLDADWFPVEMVSWDDASEFCRKLSALPLEVSAGRIYRLPTDAEWEYACRGGTEAAFHFGCQLDGTQANCRGTVPYGTSTEGPFLQRTITVGQYAANAYGLCDMHGNVWEWCSDRYLGKTGFSFRLIRGGSWFSEPAYCRSAVRCFEVPVRRDADTGFRVVRER